MKTILDIMVPFDDVLKLLNACCTVHTLSELTNNVKNKRNTFALLQDQVELFGPSCKVLGTTGFFTQGTFQRFMCIKLWSCIKYSFVSLAVGKEIM